MTTECVPKVQIHRGFEQRSEEWLSIRRGKVTGTGFAAVLDKLKGSGESAKRRAYRTQLVVERLTGCSLPGPYITAAMQWGIDQEANAMAAYHWRTGPNGIEHPPFVERTDMAVGVSPDALIGDDGLLEIKCPQAPNHLEYVRKRALPDEYVAQVQGSLWVTGRSWCDFVSYNPTFPEHLQLLVVRVERMEGYIDCLAGMVAAFLAEVEMEVESLGVLTL